MLHHPDVVLVDADSGVRRGIQLLLRGHGYRVRAYRDVVDPMRDTQTRHAGLLLADESLPRLGRISLLARLRADGWAGIAVLMTQRETEEMARRATTEGFQTLLAKPLRPSLLLGEAASARHRVYR
jgi:FixJ family two-component response regulator